MRFRIEESKLEYPDDWEIRRFTVESTEAWWPFGGWENYYREEWPNELAGFGTLEQARKFIAEEKEKFRLRELERKRTQPVYHKP